MRVRDLIRELERRGWRLDRIKGSHHVFRHEQSTRPVVVPVHGGEISSFKAQLILKQAADALKGK
ncbi:MAG: type II toxin-antitoxin system HicA family toxin [Deltaproteobacteria bacterium]|nr:type II toxin-antitoxin system HicA family toxin [Deltaproteobacteria bacterium]